MLNRSRIEFIFKRVLLGMRFLNVTSVTTIAAEMLCVNTKINKDQRAISCEAEEGIDSGFEWLLHLSDVSRL
jgi:hypothetical protein